jgi:hypothetical protein
MNGEETLTKIKSFFGDFFKNIFPTNQKKWFELVLFIITIVLLVIIIDLISNTVIQSRVKKESRCYRDKILNRPGFGQYSAAGFSLNGVEIFKITYNFAAKTYIIEQVCRQGNTVNRIDIPVYDISTGTQTTVTKNFQCEENFDVNTNGIIYKGFPGLVSFMQYGNIDFFVQMQES